MHHQVSPPDSIVLEFSTPAKTSGWPFFFKQELPLGPQTVTDSAFVSYPRPAWLSYFPRSGERLRPPAAIRRTQRMHNVWTNLQLLRVLGNHHLFPLAVNTRTLIVTYRKFVTQLANEFAIVGTIMQAYVQVKLYVSFYITHHGESFGFQCLQVFWLIKVWRVLYSKIKTAVLHWLCLGEYAFPFFSF